MKKIAFISLLCAILIPYCIGYTYNQSKTVHNLVLYDADM